MYKRQALVEAVEVFYLNTSGTLITLGNLTAAGKPVIGAVNDSNS